ncbi:restriction endonuclease subunit S [candidate division WWE3 bacterium]|jgi:type I restriction enzyme S subunit|uniref:Restriction endonuclease subunit S n=1 Tax=candidate division WWE3 bacterium TaxID=2053526 RepID=A0A3A4ZFJ8_UNCKA|nr:MAG: restriction endonuclease subunit S [candidate division WWE3 bacterium]
MKSNWNIKKLKDINIIFFKGISPKIKGENGDTVLIPSGAVFPTGVNYEKTKLFYAKRLNINDKYLKPGDILFNCGGVGTLGRSGVFEPPTSNLNAIPDSFVLIIRSDETEVLNKYIYYYFQTEFIQNKIKENTRGATGITSIKVDAILNFPISYPQISIQMEIIQKLDKIQNDLILAKNNYSKSFTDSKIFLQSYIDKFFLLNQKVSRETDLGKLLTDLSDYHANGSYKTLKDHVSLSKKVDYAWMVRSTDFENNFENDLRYINQSSYEFLKKSRLFGNEIIMSKIGNAGKVYYMPKTDKPCSLAMNLFLLRTDENTIRSKYLYYYLLSSQGDTQIRTRLKGATTQTITKENVRNIKVPVLPLTLQNKLIDKFEAFQNVSIEVGSIYQKQINTISDLRNSIFNYFLLGKYSDAL